MIEQEQKFPTSWQKLIYSGSILTDSDVVAEKLGSNSSAFLVLAVKKVQLLGFLFV